MSQWKLYLEEIYNLNVFIIKETTIKNKVVFNLKNLEKEQQSKSKK